MTARYTRMSQVEELALRVMESKYKHSVKGVTSATTECGTPYITLLLAARSLPRLAKGFEAEFDALVLPGHTLHWRVYPEVMHEKGYFRLYARFAVTQESV